MQYKVDKGIKCKLIKHIILDEYNIEPWITRKDILFSENACGINPEMLKINPERYNFDSVAVKLAQEGYALFCNEKVFNADSRYFLAVKYDLVKNV
jgi:hypothetical protein